MPEHRVISTVGEQPPLVGQTLAAIFLLFFIFQIREYCYNCSNYCGNTSYQSNNTFTSHTQSLPKLNSSNCWQSLGANRQFRHFQNQYSIYIVFCIDKIGQYRLRKKKPSHYGRAFLSERFPQKLPATATAHT